MKYFKLRICLFKISTISYCIIASAYVWSIIFSGWNVLFNQLFAVILCLIVGLIRIAQCTLWKKHYQLIYLVILLDHIPSMGYLDDFYIIFPIAICVIELIYFYKRRNTWNEAIRTYGNTISIE